MVSAPESGALSTENVPTLPHELLVEKDAMPRADLFNGSISHGKADTKVVTHSRENEIPQLPSPSPSPKSLSPSLAAADSQSEYTAPSTTINGHKFSGSFEIPTSLHLSQQEDAKDENTISSPPPISKTLPALELHAIPEEKLKKTRNPSISKTNGEVLKLTAAEVEELTSAPESLPVISPTRPVASGATSPVLSLVLDEKFSTLDATRPESEDPRIGRKRESSRASVSDGRNQSDQTQSSATRERPRILSRASSSQNALRTPSFIKTNLRQASPRRKPLPPSGIEPLDLNQTSIKESNGTPKVPLPEQPPSPMPQFIPLPPMSIPTYLQLELSSSRPSPLYIYRSHASEKQYESSRIKFERLLNFLLLPPQLEQVLYFGSWACLDAWLYTFTILPLRFFKALAILVKWWAFISVKEVQFIGSFIYHGSGRMWHRQRGRAGSIDSPARSRSVSRAPRPPTAATTSLQSPANRVPETLNGASEHLKAETERKSRPGWGRKHRRRKSQPSSLSSYHKADLLQGAVIICSCIILLKLDASRMYHGIRVQSAIKLYVIYNLLEVCDRLFSAIGQDIFECLFSDETLERDTFGRSKILRPLGMFILALIYNVIHATALFYQVIALNVAVNSHSNALITLLMSNQFVEIKSTVFKKFEKDNLFQLTCADVVERFQLWLMLIIIALRNIVEVGALRPFEEAASAPIPSGSFLPDGFFTLSIFPSWSVEVLTPFLFVLGTEMGVDWIKHAYISKFNCVKPAVYQRYLDVLAKDYYTNAFVHQNLVKRLGLPVIPLSCLFIRSSVQTYQMFLATRTSPSIPTTTSLSVESSSPATTAALEHFDNIIQRALGSPSFTIPNPFASTGWHLPSVDDSIAALTMLVFFLGVYLVLLACKLVLGMVLLRFARNRYQSMKVREQANQSYDTGGKRIGGWGMVEVDEDKRRWIYDDDPETLRKLKEKERAQREKAEKGGAGDFSRISRYEMSAKRIW